MRGSAGDGGTLTNSSPSAIPGLVEHFFRHEYGRLVAILSRKVGVANIELVEDAVQTALMAALGTWVTSGVPNDANAWLYRVAHNHLIGELRKDAGRSQLLEVAAAESAGERDGGEAVHPADDGDELLRMLFVCCDEGLPRDSRLVLALKTLCGFSTREIALRLFISEANVLKRLGRARERLRAAPPDAHSLTLDALRPRLPSVHLVLYLLFNEGYLSAQSDVAIRRELCNEAIRLTTLLAEHRVGETPETFALLSLMHLHAARVAARVDGLGGLVLLEEQDRSLWDQEQIHLGITWLHRAADGDTFTRFHAEAAIAAEHALAASFAETRWEAIAGLYELLDRISPSPLHAMNRAVAVAEWQGAEAGLAVLSDIDPPPWLLSYHLWDAVLGELHRRAGHTESARLHTERALALAPTGAERDLLRRRLA